MTKSELIEAVAERTKITKSRAELGFTPRIGFGDGMAELAEWLARERADDRVERATAELASRGLVA